MSQERSASSHFKPAAGSGSSLTPPSSAGVTRSSSYSKIIQISRTRRDPDELIQSVGTDSDDADDLRRHRHHGGSLRVKSWNPNNNNNHGSPGDNPVAPRKHLVGSLGLQFSDHGLSLWFLGMQPMATISYR